MSENYEPSDPTMAERWRRTLEDMGVHVVRARFVQSPGGSGAIIGGLGTEHITKGYVEQWLREKEAAIQKVEAHRYRRVLAWTILAAVAAWIAAWPVLKEAWLVFKGFLRSLWPH
jgi:hypothetical protein